MALQLDLVSPTENSKKMGGVVTEVIFAPIFHSGKFVCLDASVQRSYLISTHVHTAHLPARMHSVYLVRISYLFNTLRVR